MSIKKSGKVQVGLLDPKRKKRHREGEKGLFCQALQDKPGQSWWRKKTVVAGPSVSIPSQPVDVTVEVRSRHLLGESEDEAEVEGMWGWLWPPE